MPVARDWMTPMPTTVTEDTPVSRVAVLLSRHAFRHLPVVDSDGVLVGLALDYSVFSRGTLVWGGRQGCDLWLAYNPDEADDPVRQVMQPVQGVVAETDGLPRVARFDQGKEIVEAVTGRVRIKSVCLGEGREGLGPRFCMAPREREFVPWRRVARG